MGKRWRSGQQDRSSAAAMRSVLGGLRTRSVLGGDDENMIWVVGRRDLGGGGSTIWDGRSLAEVSLEMGFGPCEECA